MSLGHAPQLVLANLVHLDGSPAFTGHYMVDIISVYDGSNPSERFVCSGRQKISLTGYRDHGPGDILGTTRHHSSAYPWTPSFTPHDAHHDVAPVAESPTIPVPPRPIFRTHPRPANFYVNTNLFFASGTLLPPASTG